MNPHLQFKLTTETGNTITYMDLNISRRDDKLELSIYRKPIETGTVIHNNSNHPYEQNIKKNLAPSSILREAKVAYYARNIFEAGMFVLFFVKAT